MSEDTDVMFRIGVMDHPASKAALESLAKNVDSAQARMTAGVVAIGETATKVGSSIDNLIGKIDEMARHQETTMRSAMPESVQPAGQNQRGAMPASSSGTSAVSSQASAAIDSVATLQSRIDSFDASNISSSLRNVFSELGDVAETSVDEIIGSLDAFEDRMTSMVDGVEGQAEILRTAYQNQMIEHSETYAAMAKDLDGYLAQHGTTAEKIQANINIGDGALKRYRDAASNTTLESNKMFVESALHVAQMAKGLATIGLVSEESAEKFMQSLAVIQGTFDVVKGGVEAYEKFRRGVKLAGEATEFLSKAKKTEAALQTVEIARMKAYHASLLQEAAAANTAAAANGRLAASRTAAGASGAAAAAGSAASAAGSGAGMLGRFGGLGRFAGGALGTTAAAGAAAAGGIYLAGRAIKETATGESTQTDSSIAALEARVGAWALRLTGLFESTDAPMVKLAQGFSSMADKMLGWVPGGDSLKNLNVAGDIAGLAASQAGVERGEASLARNRINNDAEREKALERAKMEAERDRMRFQASGESIRSAAVNATTSFGFQGQTQNAQADWQAMQERSRLRNVKDERVLGQATVSQASDNATRMRGAPDAAFVQMAAEANVLDNATKRYASAKAEMDKTLAFAGSSDAERALATERAKAAQDDMVRSLERHAQLARASGANRLQIEREIQSQVMAGIDQQQAKLDALNDRRKSAMKSFVEMDAVERDMATKALAKARTGGGASLSKEEANILGRVGTDETNQFVDQATEAQAKKLGFDQTFGTSMEENRKQIEGTKQQLEAQLQASFDVSMQVEADTDAIVDAIAPQVEQAMRDITASVEQKLTDRLDAEIQRLETKRTQDLAQLKRG